VRLDFAVADTSALLAIVGVLPIEAPRVDFLYATDASLVEAIAVLRSFHEGRLTDIRGDLALIGPMVSVAHRDELITDLAAVAAAKVTKLPLVTGQPGLAGLDPDVAVIVLPRSPK
jgi:hypothetical protein